MSLPLIIEAAKEEYPHASKLLQTYDIVVIELFQGSETTIPVTHIFTKSLGLAFALSKLPSCGIVSQGKDITILAIWLNGEDTTKVLKEYVSIEEEIPQKQDLSIEVSQEASKEPI